MSTPDTPLEEEYITFEELEKLDVISVELVPERKGLILKHCEYLVSSRRHGTTVTRRYNEFLALYDVLLAKYPYRAVCRLPPKRVVVGGGSERFLQRRRAALQRWLALVAAHPVLAHDADTRAFLCEPRSRLLHPQADEFTMAGPQDQQPQELSTEEMQATFVSEQEQLRLVQLGLVRLFQIFERAEQRCEAERAEVQEMGAALASLSVPASTDTARWTPVRVALKQAALVAGEASGGSIDSVLSDNGLSEGAGRMRLALEALGAARELCARLSRGLHAERAAAAAAAPYSPAAHTLRTRHRYALKCAREEVRVARAYALSALLTLPELFQQHATAQARIAALWAQLHSTLRTNTT